jgi:hypothetical protein
VWLQEAGSDPTLSIKSQTEGAVNDDGDEIGQRVEAVPSSTVLVAVLVHRNGEKMGEKAQMLATRYKEDS